MPELGRRKAGSALPLGPSENTETSPKTPCLRLFEQMMQGTYLWHHQLLEVWLAA
jgi:hypothetical protein